MSFYETKREGCLLLRSTALTCPHAFSTRFGGVSRPAHLATLNLGEGRGDDPAALAENYRRFLKAAGLPSAPALARQVHSARVLTVRRQDFPSLLREKPALDGFVTAERGISLCVKIADCLPLLLEDAEAGVVGALHGGWRGSADGIAAKGVAAMVAIGARPSRIRCAIGPSIHACCFRVGEDFLVEFREKLARIDLDAELFLRREEDGGCFADLQALNRTLLLRAGLLPAHIDVSPACTCCDPVRFFSHRATGGLRGTMAAAIALPEAP